MVEAQKYGWLIGQMPRELRGPELQMVWIHRGDEAWGGGFKKILIHTGRSAKYEELSTSKGWSFTRP